MEELNNPKIEVGCGLGHGADSGIAGAEAARRAMEGIHQHPISAILVFASVRYDLEELLAGIHSITGEAPVMGATTAGEICNGPQHESVVVVALASPYLTVRAGLGEGVSKDWQQAVHQATQAPEVHPYFCPREEQIWPALIHQGKSAFAMLFSPGNTRHADSKSYEILEELKQLSQGRLPFFGGSAADDWQMERNYVLLGRQAYADSVLVAVFETQLSFGIGLAHGFRPGSHRATITRANGHEVLELDGEPAAEVYARMVGNPRDALEGKHLTLTTGVPAGTPDPYGLYSINVASYFTPQGGIRFTQPTPEGTMLTIMDADRDNMIAAGQDALRKALLRGGISVPATAFVCSCALRTRILGERTGEEIAGMSEMMPGIPLLGFYSFGEQGLADDGVNRHSNEVITVLVLGQELSYAARVALENQRLREDLQQSEERFRVLVESMDDVIFTLDREQRHTGVFGHWIEKQGLTDEVFLGRTAHEIMGEEAAVPHREANERALAGENVVYDWSTEGMEGIQNYQTSLSPIRDAQGDIVGLVGVGRDVSERKRAEDTLRAENSFRRAIIESAAEGLCVCHDVLEYPFVEFTVWNDRMTELTGYSMDEINRLGWYQTVYSDPEIQQQAQQRMERMRDGDNLLAEEWVITRADGEPRTILISTAVLQASDGQAHALAMMHDITERKRAEEMRERLIARLEDALDRVKALSGLLPICASCKKIRDDQGYWTQVEVYVREHSEADFSHGLCPDCQWEMFPPEKYPFLYREDETSTG